MTNQKRKIVIITGSRGEYGYIRPIIHAIENDPALDYQLIVTNMHLLDEFGYSVDEIKKDKFKIGARIINTFDGYNPISMTKSLSVFLLQLPEILDMMKPDLILLAGDRGEQLMAAIAGAHLYIPVAHIQAGEISGNIDGVTRHAIARFAHLHFASSRAARDRVIATGEQDWRVYQTGAPQLDELYKGVFTPPDEIAKKFHLRIHEPIIILIQHPVTEEFNSTAEHLRETLEAVALLKKQTIMILPNSDAGSKTIRDMLLRYRRPYIQIHRSIVRTDFAGLMNVASVIVGNSSAGIIESPVFKLPAVNIGRRQSGREQAENIINVSNNRTDILQAIKRAMSPEFRALCQNCKNPYGDGQSSGRIVNILKTIPIDERLLIKQLVY